MRRKLIQVRGRVERARAERQLQRDFLQASPGVQADIIAALQRREA